jgi:hypothetical protein
MRVRKLTPVLYVEEIEPCLDFWYQLGFEKTAEVPEGDRLGFAILKKDVVEIMYQTRASVGNDIPVLNKTFYGADEVIVREPSGNVVAFAQFGAVD